MARLNCVAKLKMFLPIFSLPIHFKSVRRKKRDTDVIKSTLGETGEFQEAHTAVLGGQEPGRENEKDLLASLRAARCRYCWVRGGK